MKKTNCMMLVSVFLLAMIQIEAIIFGGLGIGVIIGVGAYFVCVFLYGRLEGRKQKNKEKWLLIPIVLTTLCFGLFSNNELRFFNVLFLMGLLLIHGVEYFGKSQHEMFLPSWCLELIGLGVSLPFSNLDKPIALIKSEMSFGNREKVKVLGKILIGLVIALPLIAIVLSLLISSDAAFDQVVKLFLNQFWNMDLNWNFSKGIVTIILFFILFSYFYGLTHENGVSRENILESQDEWVATNKLLSEIKHIRTKGLDFTIVATVSFLICIIYVVFCLSQSVYFISAFQGILPSGFNYAEYARRGFFETLPLAGVNLMLIGILYLRTNFNGSNKKKNCALGMICFISAFTLFMVICALAKMGMYMNTYGLTLKRVEVAWFLCLVIVVIVLVMLKVFIERFKFIKTLFIVFTVMYLGLNYANIDYVISAYNVGLYREGITNNLSGCSGLSSSAIGPIYKLLNENKEEVLQEELVLGVQRVMYGSQINNWQSWNLADYYGLRVMEDIERDEVR